VVLTPFPPELIGIPQRGRRVPEQAFPSWGWLGMGLKYNLGKMGRPSLQLNRVRSG